MKLVQILADIICRTLLDPQALARSRNRKGAFARNCGKFPYWTLIKLLLSNVKKSVSASLDEFFHELCLASGSPLPDTVKCSQQAFSKARSGISHTIFQECFERMLDFLCSKDSLDFHVRFTGVWGRQIIAIDGSKIPLPNRKALLDKYGSTGRGANSPTAIASVAFDVLNDRVLDAQFEPVSVDERTLAIRHMENIKSKARTNLSPCLSSTGDMLQKISYLISKMLSMPGTFSGSGLNSTRIWMRFLHHRITMESVITF